MRITCLVDNAVQHSSQLLGEHGLSFLIETKAGRLLFDTGQSGKVLMHNMDTLKIDPKTIDALAISHAHYDHTGGLPLFLEHTQQRLPLYANPDLFEERFSRRRGEPRFIGMPLSRDVLASKTELHLDGQPQEILPGVWTTGEITPREYALGRSPRHVVRGPKGWIPDPYLDDMSLVLELGSELVLLCGCCHAGLLNTLSHVQRVFDRPIAAVAGGTHLARANADCLQDVASVLQQMESLQHVYLNHCSGETAFHTLWEAVGSDVVHPCPAGTRIELDTRR